VVERENRHQRAVRQIAQADGIIEHGEIADQESWQHLTELAAPLRVSQLEHLLELNEQARVLAFWHPSGGVGKTTSTINAAWWLSRELGGVVDENGSERSSVLVIDFDPRADLSTRLGLWPGSPAIGRCIDERLSVPPESVPVRWRVRQGSVMIDFWPSTERGMFTANNSLQRDIGDRNKRLLRMIEPVASRYRYILIDCPPGFDLPSINGMVATTQSLGGLVMTTEAVDKAYIALPDTFANLVRMDDDHRPNIVGILPTITEADDMGREVFNVLRNNHPHLTMPFAIPRRAEVKLEGRKQAPVSKYAAAKDAGRTYRLVAQEIIQRTTITGYLAASNATNEVLQNHAGDQSRIYDEYPVEGVLDRA